MRGVGRSGHSRVPQNFPHSSGGYDNHSSKPQTILRERATKNEPHR